MTSYIMHRTQISLEEWQHQKLKAVAEREGRSISSLVRDAVAVFLDSRRPAPATRLAEIAGIGNDREARGRDHDRVLYGPRRRRS
jgi:hypothetical protein